MFTFNSKMQKMQRTHLYFSSKIKNICMYVLIHSFHISVHIACPFASMYLGIQSKHEHSVRHVQLIHTVHWKKKAKFKNAYYPAIDRDYI